MSRRRTEKPKRLVICGLGDVGVLVANFLGKFSAEVEIVAVTPKARVVSGQELGGRIAQPQLWKELYCLPFNSYTGLDGATIVRGLVSSVDFSKQTLRVRRCREHHGNVYKSDDERDEAEETAETTVELAYDLLLISTGCSNGFWKTALPQDEASIMSDIDEHHERIKAAGSVAVVGAGPAGVGAAYALKQRWPNKRVHLFFPGPSVLRGYHARVQEMLRERLRACGVQLHPHHRAVLPSRAESGSLPSLSEEQSLKWSTGQAPFAMNASQDTFLVLWTVGHTRPNTNFLPSSALTKEGFVRVDQHLRVKMSPNQLSPEKREDIVLDNVFAVGDVAATDPQRTSARNFAYLLIRDNILARVRKGPEAKLQSYSAPKHRWGSILGVWEDGSMELFLDQGLNIRFRAWLWRRMWPLFQRFIFGGIRQPVHWALRTPTPLVRFKRSCFELDLALIMLAIGLGLAVLLFKCLCVA
eukprot:INCI11885.1.p1 GENE.INCI11885.1~~INCI11885.1.p1  ORF type:complete len:471 (+),score=63.35 INCI11885.1:169-1581(+)